MTAGFAREEGELCSAVTATTEETGRCWGGTNGGGGGGRLLDGEYDEKTSAQLFQEALREWRGCKGEEEHTISTIGMLCVINSFILVGRLAIE